MRHKDLFNFEVHVTDHCNLNCAGCGHFSPLVKEGFLNPTGFEKDCSRISTLIQGRIGSFSLMGGEPLLHPDIIDIITITRKYFRKGNVRIITNGILLANKSDTFWLACKKNNIKIIITRYPITLPIEKIKRLAVSFNVTWSYFGGAEASEKSFVKIPLDPFGRQNGNENYKMCPLANRDLHLREGKIYNCATSAYIDFSNTHFNWNIPVTESDYRDIYKIKDTHEIFDFLHRPIFFCRYCGMENIVTEIPWAVSKKEISEWI
jgi:MoaA/NifB/PqqE/SkfB family radical SAM enzyme